MPEYNTYLVLVHKIRPRPGNRFISASLFLHVFYVQQSCLGCFIADRKYSAMRRAEIDA